MNNNQNESRGVTVLGHSENLQIAKIIDPCQPARTAQADVSRFFSHMN